MKNKKNLALPVTIMSLALLAVIFFMEIPELYGSEETVSEHCISIDDAVLGKEEMDSMAAYMDPIIIKEVTESLGGSSTSRDFIKAYVAADPDFQETLKENFGVFVE